MRNKFKMIIGLMLSVCLACGVLAGCGSGGDEDENTVLTVNMNSVLNNYAGDGRKACVNAKKVIDAGGAGATNEFIMGYNLTNYLVSAMEESGYSVDYYNWGWGTNLINKQNNALMSKGGCDVFIGESAWLKSFAMTGGLKAFPQDLETFVRENCLPASYAAMEYNGKIYGINVETTPLILMINMDLAKEIFGNDYQPPKTWSEWTEQMKYIKNHSAYIPGGPILQADDAGYIRNNVFFRQQGFDFSSEVKPDFNNANVKYTLDFFKEVSDIHTNLSINMGDYTSMQNAFVNGQQVFLVDSSAYYNQIIATNNFNVKNAYYSSLPVPDSVPGNSDYDPEKVDQTSTPAGLITSCVYSVPAYVGGKKADAAFDFIRKYLDVAPQTYLRDSKTFCAVLKSIVDPTAEENKEFFSKDPQIETFYKFLDNDQATSTPVWAYDNTKCWSQVGIAITETRKATPDLSGKMSAIQSQLELYFNNWNR